MPYHVRVSTRSNPFADEVRLDLTREELEDRFLRPYREGRPIVVGGRTVEPADLVRLRVNYTVPRSAELAPLVRKERRQSGIQPPLSDEWYIADWGEETTDDLITGPPGPHRPELNAVPLSTPTAAPDSGLDPRSVFVVHGRNLDARNAMFAFLKALDLKPIEWHDAVGLTRQSNPYVGEILDAAFDHAQVVVVLMTPDEEVRLREHFREPGNSEPISQSRPNVLFEAGMAMGRDQKRVVLVEFGQLRPFSDIGGRHTLHLNNSLKRRRELADRLLWAGAAVKLDDNTEWHTAGDFSPPA